MSLMAMNRAFKKHGPIWGGILAFVMIIGVVLTGFGANVAGGGPDPTTGAAAGKTVATVGEAKVTAEELERRLEAALRQQSSFGAPPNLSAADKANFRFMILNGIKQEQAMVAAAKKAGVTVTDADIAAQRRQVWEQNRTGFLTTLGLPEKATDRQIEQELAKQQVAPSLDAFLKVRLPDDALRMKAYNDGLQAALKKQAGTTEAEVRRSYNDIRVRHILIKTGEGGLPEGAAKAKAEKLLADINANPSRFAELADRNSDDPGNKDPKTNRKNGGLYDWAPASQYVPEFTGAALKAGVGKVYPEPVKTTYGFHIIKLEGERPGKSLPADFDKEKQKYIDQFAERQVLQKMQAAIDAEMPSVAIVVTDPLLRAAQLQEEARKLTGDEKARNAKYEEALTELAKVNKDEDPNGAIPQMKTAIYSAMKKNKEAIVAANEALNYGNTVEARIALAQLYLDEKDNKNALAQLAEAEKLAVPSFQMQGQIGELYAKAGDKAKAAAAQKKAQEMLMRMIQLQQKQQEAAKAAAPPPTAPTGSTAPTTASPAPTTASPAPASPAAASPDPKAP
ncbi:MAG: peptidylprolyl isomerase [Capsulimonadales bacterium]|nr:peptidylprolyl isomerase [Capsulimonadales bacterium]